MNLREFKRLLREHADRKLTFVHPDGEPIPDDFHITEVGHVTKRFVDCGGTMRVAESVVLQTWVSESDKGHRLTAGKAADILERSGGVIPSENLAVEIEYEGCVLSQYALVSHLVHGGEISFQMERKHTDCLAKELCGAAHEGGAEAGGCCS